MVVGNENVTRYQIPQDGFHVALVVLFFLSLVTFSHDIWADSGFIPLGPRFLDYKRVIIQGHN